MRRIFRILLVLTVVILTVFGVLVIAGFYSYTLNKVNEIDVSFESIELKAVDESEPQVFNRTIILYSNQKECIIRLNIDKPYTSDLNFRIKEFTYTINLMGHILSEGYIQDIEYHEREGLSILLYFDDLIEQIPDLFYSMIEEDIMPKISVHGELKAVGTVHTPSILGFIRVTEKVEYHDEISILLMQNLKVDSVLWIVDGRSSGECLPGDEVNVIVDVSSLGDFNETLSVYVKEDVPEADDIIIYTEDVKLEMVDIGQKSIEFSLVVPVTPNPLSEGYYLEVGIKNALICQKNITESPVLELIHVYSIIEALASEYVDASITGTGSCAGDALFLDMELKAELKLGIKIEAGNVLMNSGSGQNMIIAETFTIIFRPKVDIELTRRLRSYCLDFYRNNPSYEETLNIILGAGGYSNNAVRLMQSLDNTPSEYKSIRAIQIALWVITDDISRQELSQVFIFSENDIQNARWMLENIGMDTSISKLFE